MKGWVLYKHNQHTSQKTFYSVERILQEAQIRNIQLEIVTPETLWILFEKWEVPEFIFPRMWAYTPLWVIEILKKYEKFWVFVVNGGENIQHFSDKKKMYELLEREKFLIPQTYQAKIFLKNMSLLSYPYICKKRFGMWWKNVFLIENVKQYEQILWNIWEDNFDDFVFQECISPAIGKDIRVCMLGNISVASYKRQAVWNEFRANFSLGSQLFPHHFGGDIEEMSKKIMKIYNLDFIGIDFLYDGEKYYVWEVNTASWFLSAETIMQFNIVGKVFDYIIEKVQKK